MAIAKPHKERELAKKLRIVNKKSLGEISELTGIAKSTLWRWAKAEGWPDPEKERQSLKQIIMPQTQTTKDLTSSDRNVTNTNPMSAKQLSELPEIDFTAKPEVLADKLFRWAARIVQNAAMYSLPAAIKLMEISAKVMVALHTPQPAEMRKLTIMIPAVAETYRDPPDEE